MFYIQKSVWKNHYHGNLGKIKVINFSAFLFLKIFYRFVNLAQSKLRLDYKQKLLYQKLKQILKKRNKIEAGKYRYKVQDENQML